MPRAATGREAGVADPIGEGALALSHRLRSRELSCRELMALTLDRIAARDQNFNAIPILAEREALMAEAAVCDEEIARGHWRGWLHGIPQAIKDLAHAKGLRTTWGSPLFADCVATEDSIHVARMRAAGAIIIGKTNTPEFGLGSHTYNALHGLTRNAHDPALSAGGSSGGAAVALARGFLAVADGSDMGGSLRNPAGWNGVFGFRPSFGRVPQTVADEAYLGQLTTDGPMGVTIADVAQLLATQAGYHPAAPLSLSDDPTLGEIAIERGKGLRIGWLGDYNGHCATEPGVLALCEQALRHFENLGATVESVRIPFDLERLWQAFCTLRQFGITGRLGAIFRDPVRREFMKPELQWEISQGSALPADSVYRASCERTAWARVITGLFQQYDVLALPSAQVFAFPAEWHWPREIAGRAMDTYHRWMEIVAGPSMAGGPVCVVPAGRDAQGRHMGLQLWGPARADAAVLSAAAAYEQAARPVCLKLG
ncbi:MAG: amidase [Gammaproteobacteria bacterium]|nr:amidase [Gammaproteobacteria bacterium]